MEFSGHELVHLLIFFGFKPLNFTKWKTSRIVKTIELADIMIAWTVRIEKSLKRIFSTFLLKTQTTGKSPKNCAIAMTVRNKKKGVIFTFTQ